MNQNYDLGFFIGRFQPFHLGHQHVIQSGLDACDRMVIVVGSDLPERSHKNPFLMPERINLIQSNLDSHFGQDFSRIVLKPMMDFEDDQDWIKAVSDSVLDVANPNDKIGLIGHDKDPSCFYLKYFPQWGFVDVPNFNGINATDIREAYFAKTLFDNPDLLKYLSPETEAFLRGFSEFIPEKSS